MATASAPGCATGQLVGHEAQRVADRRRHHGLIAAHRQHARQAAHELSGGGVVERDDSADQLCRPPAAAVPEHRVVRPEVVLREPVDPR